MQNKLIAEYYKAKIYFRDCVICKKITVIEDDPEIQDNWYEPEPEVFELFKTLGPSSGYCPEDMAIQAASYHQQNIERKNEKVSKIKLKLKKDISPEKRTYLKAQLLKELKWLLEKDEELHLWPDFMQAMQEEIEELTKNLKS